MNVMSVRPAEASNRADRHERTVWPFAALVAAAGLVMLGYALLSAPGWLTGVTLTVCGANPTGPHAVLLAGVLFVLAWGLARGRQTAWALFLGLLAWSVVAEIEAAIAPGSAAPWRLAPLGIAIVGLWHARARFRVPLNATRLKQAAEISALSVTAILVVGGGGLFMERSRFETPVSAPDIGRTVVAMAAANQGPAAFNGPAWQTNGLALLTGALVIVVTGWLLASAPAPRPGNRAQRAILRAMISHPDSETLAPFALRYDKSYVFSADGRAAIGYRVLAGMAVAGGDPVGARDSWPGAVEEFCRVVERSGWRPAVLGAGPDARPLWQERGMRCIGIGDEVIVDTHAFTLHGRPMRNVRQAVRRTERAGLVTEVILERQLDPGLAGQLRRIHREWLGAAGREHGFAMNLDAMAKGVHPDALVAVAMAPEGYAVAFQRYLPTAHAGQNAALSLDVMPRTPLSPNGVNERLIVDVIDYARNHGYPRVSLNFAAFRPLLAQARSEPASLTKTQRATIRAIGLLDPLIQVESLYRFNDKFQPGWTPRAVLVGSWLDLPRFAVAAFGLEFALPYDRRRTGRTVTAGDPDFEPLKGPQPVEARRAVRH
ncbi:MAG TPA: phosphatidylglycerol lysyltransferase domain-containing protein [Actinospica sp.]|jgi:lysyl-tRNA synthetase class 2|nr:phosphatidylglycerol lysyltransferase domain-containing protein [Actinospica sp.]